MPVPRAGTGIPIEARLGRKPLWCGDTGPETVQRVARCTGAVKVSLIAQPALVLMPLLPGKFLNKPFTLPASRDCISMLPATMLPNAAVFVH